MPDYIDIRIRFDRDFNTVDGPGGAAQAFADQLAPALIEGKPIPPTMERARKIHDTFSPSWGYGLAKVIAVEPA